MEELQQSLLLFPLQRQQLSRLYAYYHACITDPTKNPPVPSQPHSRTRKSPAPSATLTPTPTPTPTSTPTPCPSSTSVSASSSSGRPSTRPHGVPHLQCARQVDLRVFSLHLGFSSFLLCHDSALAAKMGSIYRTVAE